MSQIMQIKSPVLAAVTDKTGYVEARNQAEKLSLENGLKVADMPLVIQAMTSHPEVREAIRPIWIDTITGEYHGQRDGDRSYETWHSAGSLATAKGLEKMFSKAGAMSVAIIESTMLALTLKPRGAWRFSATIIMASVVTSTSTMMGVSSG